jgi:very-short-patch-repair endonuclease
MRYRNRTALRKKRALARQLRQESTPEEKILWRHLRSHNLDGFHFRRQHVLAGFIVDFYCWKAHLIIELDGKHHDVQREADEHRDAILRGMDNEILRFANAKVRNEIGMVLETIKEVLTRRSSPSVPPSPDGGRGTGGWGWEVDRD